MTHCDRILDRLRRGPASHLELYALGTVAHSRISDLRKRGFQIDQRKEGDLYVYELLSEPPSTLPGGGSLSSLGADEDVCSTGVEPFAPNLQEALWAT